jgi:hypothetical protein
LLAKALDQSLLSRLKRRLREQAPSHSFCKAFCTDSLHSSAELEPPLVRHSTQFTVGGSLLAKALDQSLLSRLARRLREQAPSHSFCKAFCTDSLHSSVELQPPSYAIQRNSPWEGACSRMLRISRCLVDWHDIFASKLPPQRALTCRQYCAELLAWKPTSLNPASNTPAGCTPPSETQ